MATGGGDSGESEEAEETVVGSGDRRRGVRASAMTIAGGDSDGGSEEEGEETTAGSGGCNFVVLGVQNIISFVFFSLNYV
jgi:hypothetical protein